MSTLFVGLGRMGAPMARRHSAAFPTVLYDVGPAAAQLATELGSEALPDLGRDLSNIDTLILMVPSSQIVESILLQDGVLERLPESALIIDMSSSRPSSTRRLHDLASVRGIGFVDAPVSGGQAKAASGELTVMVGGDESSIKRALPHIETMSSSIVVVGPSGAGHAAKALNNLVSATNIAVAAEALSAAVRLGIEPSVMIDVLNGSTGRSQSTEVKYPKHILPGTWDSKFSMELMVKDLGIARELIEEAGLYAPVTESANGVAQRAITELSSESGLDHTELARYYEERNGVSLRQE